MEQEFSPRRCKDTRKPPADQCPEVAFYRCPACKALYPVTGGKIWKTSRYSAAAIWQSA